MLSEKSPAEKLDDNNQKRLQKIVGFFLYYYRLLDPTTMMALSSLAAVQTNMTTKTAKQVVQFLNYSVAHTYSVTKYRRS